MRFLIVILSLALVFFIGMIVADELVPRQRPTLVHIAVSHRVREVVRVETKMVPYEVVKVVPYQQVFEVEKVVEVVKEVAKPVVPKDWDSLEELDAFWGDHKVSVTLIAGKDGESQLNGQCVAYAAAHRDAAAALGKDLSIYRLMPWEYNRLFEQIRKTEAHAVNMALVDYELWLIEPETGERVFHGYVP